MYKRQDLNEDIINEVNNGVAIIKYIGNGDQTTLSSEKIITWFTKGPAKVMGWKIIPFQVGQKAEIVIINPKKKWEFKESDIQSRSKNRPGLSPQLSYKYQLFLPVALANHVP